MIPRILYSLFTFGVALIASAQSIPEIDQRILESQPEVLELYQHLHANPELSLREEKTSALLATKMRALGFEVTERVGGFGVVCVFKNGPGKTLLVRTDMDGLPVEEKTGLAFASNVRTKDDLNRDLPVMHACAHDFHMACWYGAAKALTRLRSKWSGTLIFIAQPAEELGAGALAMIKSGLFENFPRPDIGLALHNMNGVPSGSIGLTRGPASANTDSVDITVKGLGGHGAMPDKSKDPVVLASQIVLALQTIRSRELPPQEPAVLTVGSIHGGSKHNIIPDEVRLQLTVRTVSKSAREKILESISRITKGLAQAAGLPERLLPEIRVYPTGTPMLTNDPQLTDTVREMLTPVFGPERIHSLPPMMGGEDFSRYGMTSHKIPLCLIWVGGTSAEEFSKARSTNSEPPSLHSPFYHPDAPNSLPAGIKALTHTVIGLTPP